MSQHTFKVGEIVVLSSGGPKMTIKKLHADDRIDCSWFARTKLEIGYFVAEQLQYPKVEE